jgi:4-diphosphocytidyl-2-C-methyl-D-erythritol kinase
MLVKTFPGSVVVWAPAKVNLFLEVLGKRPDGYHEVNTLMVAVRLFDTLILKEDASSPLQLECNRRDLSAGPDNLVLRAAHLLQKRAGCRKGARMRLVKRIPLAAGLAGGSSDAAAALIGLNRLWQLRLSEGEMADLAAELGSDIPFFFETPAAWCTGRGEKVKGVRLGRPLDFVIACPAQGLATAAVYAGVQVPASPVSGADICAAAERGEVAALGRLLYNRLEASAQKLCPAVAALSARMKELEPAGVLMSGSGSSVFALCHGPHHAQALARELGRPRPDMEEARIFRVRSCSEQRPTPHWPGPPR